MFLFLINVLNLGTGCIADMFNFSSMFQIYVSIMHMYATFYFNSKIFPYTFSYSQNLFLIKAAVRLQKTDYVSHRNFIKIFGKVHDIHTNWRRKRK